MLRDRYCNASREGGVVEHSRSFLDKGLMVDQNINPNIPSSASISVAQFPAKKPTRQWAAWTHQEEECFTASWKELSEDYFSCPKQKQGPVRCDKSKYLEETTATANSF
ncbi:hypothetical protein F2Q69_00017514 [Brassica cretica]|uniref:Uncharacterized protein n=1 Tax=Brassica cretica TaxID=69181 RepID=A0A8S9QZM7_BRACR|nr:hypothetical protein F2Q69_00017514 [Brassica cretica]